jgi:hypothetical protein
MNIANQYSFFTAVCLFSILNLFLINPGSADSGIHKSSTADGVIVEKSAANSDLVVIEPKDFKPAFTRDTVIKLNAIVGNSYGIVREFDKLVTELRHNRVVTNTTEPFVLSENQLAVVSTLAERSNRAYTDMNRAIDTLKASGEHYNAAILAGMALFVRSVNQEISLFQQNYGV